MNTFKPVLVIVSALMLVAACGDDETSNSTSNNQSNATTNNVTTNNSSNGNNGGPVNFTVEFSNQSGGEPLEDTQGALVMVTGADAVRPVILLSSAGGTFQITWTKEEGPLMPGTIETEGTFTSSDSVQCTTSTVNGEVLELVLTEVDPAAGTFSGPLNCASGTPDAFTVDVSGTFED